MTNEQAQQLRNLSAIMNAGSMSSVFKPHPQYECKGLVRIAYSDVMDNKLILREDLSGNLDGFWDGEGRILQEYQDLESLVLDGWRLD